MAAIAAVSGVRAVVGVGAAIAEGVAGEEMVTVIHFTDQAGVDAIAAQGTLRAGTFVTLPSEVVGLSADQVELRLEISAGRGAFSTTLQTPASNLMTPLNGPLTSGNLIQYQLREPQLLIRPFIRTQ